MILDLGWNERNLKRTLGILEVLVFQKLSKMDFLILWNCWKQYCGNFGASKFFKIEIFDFWQFRDLTRTVYSISNINEFQNTWYFWKAELWLKDFNVCRHINVSCYIQPIDSSRINVVLKSKPVFKACLVLKYCTL